MESYALNSYLAVSNPTWFTTWSNQPGTAEDALIKDDFSNSPTKSAIITKTGTVSTDLILKLGDKTTGKYELSWWAYVEANKCGYYNIQHFQSPGTEYAMEVYFRASGAGELLAGSATVIPFTYPKATWFQIKHIIDLDADNIQLYINGVMVSEWPFSYQASSTTGTDQLGGVDFFAGEKTGTTEVPKLYLDDIYLAQLGAPSDPIIGVDPLSLSAYLEPAASTVLPLTISNTGASELACELNIIYGPAPAKSNSSVNAPSPIHSANTFSECSAKPTNGSSRGVAATAVLNYDGDNSSAIGWNTPPVTVTVAARFPNGMTLPYAGMTVDAVDVFINDINTTGSNVMTLKIFGMGTAYEPGALLVSQTFTPAGVAWEHIVLNTPLLVNGEDLWVGYTFTQIDAGIFIPGTDAGPSNPNGDFISTGVGWSHLSNNPALAFNWNIRALLSGDVMPHWLTASPMIGTIAPDENAVVDVTFNSADLAIGVYEGYIRILNNDPTNKQLDVPCMLSVSVGINELDKISVMVYPNPAENRLNIVTNDKIVKVSVMSYNGKTVITSNQNTIDISNLASGVYFVQTQTSKGISNVKFTKK